MGRDYSDVFLNSKNFPRFVELRDGLDSLSDQTLKVMNLCPSFVSLSWSHLPTHGPIPSLPACFYTEG